MMTVWKQILVGLNVRCDEASFFKHGEWMNMQITHYKTFQTYKFQCSQTIGIPWLFDNGWGIEIVSWAVYRYVIVCNNERGLNYSISKSNIFKTHCVANHQIKLRKGRVDGWGVLKSCTKRCTECEKLEMGQKPEGGYTSLKITERGKNPRPQQQQ